MVGNIHVSLVPVLRLYVGLLQKKYMYKDGLWNEKTTVLKCKYFIFVSGMLSHIFNKAVVYIKLLFDLFTFLRVYPHSELASGRFSLN